MWLMTMRSCSDGGPDRPVAPEFPGQAAEHQQHDQSRAKRPGCQLACRSLSSWSSEAGHPAEQIGAHGETLGLVALGEGEECPTSTIGSRPICEYRVSNMKSPPRRKTRGRSCFESGQSKTEVLDINPNSRDADGPYDRAELLLDLRGGGRCRPSRRRACRAGRRCRRRSPCDGDPWPVRCGRRRWRHERPTERRSFRWPWPATQRRRPARP